MIQSTYSAPSWVFRGVGDIQHTPTPKNLQISEDQDLSRSCLSWGPNTVLPAKLRALFKKAPHHFPSPKPQLTQGLP